MKIIKISQESGELIGKQFTTVPQNPTAVNDLNIQMQNLQMAQQAIVEIGNIREAINSVLNAVDNLDGIIGGDSGIKNKLESELNNVIKKTNAFNTLAKLNLLAGVGNILDPADMSRINTTILKNIEAIRTEQGKLGVK